MTSVHCMCCECECSTHNIMNVAQGREWPVYGRINTLGGVTLPSLLGRENFLKPY